MPTGTSINHCFQRRVDDNYVALWKHHIKILLKPGPDLTLQLSIHLYSIMVQQVTVEGLQPLEQKPANSPSSNRAHSLTFEIIRPISNGRHIPVTGDDLMITWQEIADEYKDSHELVFSHRDDIAAGDLRHRDSCGSCRRQVDVVGADSGGEKKLQVFSPFDAFGRHLIYVDRRQIFLLSLVEHNMFAYFILYS
ncbi:DNA polymerase III subunit alpha [Striga asiatica]|uniref:DNA polymerase III subunit alpha n=1 Tax=Striga asiatica TaxID=4170 RepID=A0A5A7PAA6_STRAF|nr:DNA polymerase III subunit alpha [Striga asiatica]